MFYIGHFLIFTCEICGKPWRGDEFQSLALKLFHIKLDFARKIEAELCLYFCCLFHFFCTSLISGHPVLCKNIRSRQNNPKFFFKIVSNQSRYLLIKHWQSDKLIQQLKISLLQMQRLVGDKMDACSHVLRVYWGTELLWENQQLLIWSNWVEHFSR